MNSLLCELREVEQRLVFYDQFCDSTEGAVTVLHGTQPLIVSAPHSTRHWRGTDWKQEEEYTAALAYLLHREIGATAIFGRYCLNPDPHDDNDQSEYKRLLDTVIARQTRPIRFALDIHGARGDRDFAVAIGTIHGETFVPYQEALIDAFEQHGFNDDPDSSLDRLALNPSRYTGGVRQPTITRYLWRRHGIPTAQIELSAWVRIVERLPNASNAKNGNAPRFRGDGARILRIIEALQAFIKGAAKSNHWVKFE